MISLLRHPIHGPGRRTAAACLLVLGLVASGAATAQPLQDILPRSPADWHLESQGGDCPVRVSMGRTGEDSIWVFTSDSCATQVGSQVSYGLLLSDFGIPPQPPENAEYWNWRWFVRNTRTADRVTLQIVDDLGHVIDLATSHTIFDYTDDIFRLPGHYDIVWTTLSDERAYRRAKAATWPESLGKIVGIRIGFSIPNNQEVWLGRISFGPAREDPVPPYPRAHHEHISEGRCLVADLDGDGVPEVLAPWMAGNKLWRYDGGNRRFEPAAHPGVLDRARPMNLMAAGDLDGDGDLDLVASDPNDSTLWVLTNRVGGFTGDTLTVHLPEVGAMLSAMTLADDDGDGDLDLFLGYHLMGNDAHLRVWRLSGDGHGGFGPPRGLPRSAYPGLRGTYFLTLADLDGDARLDLVSSAPGCGLRIFPGLPGPAYGPPVVLDPLTDTGFQRAVRVVDLDGDGRLDLFLTFNSKVNSQPMNGRNRLFLNRGGFRFEECAWKWGLEGSGYTQDACFADVNGRGGPELVLLDDRQGLVVYDLSETVRSLRAGGPVIAARGRRLDLDPRLTSGTRRMSLQDLDGDGRVEAILSRDDGISVIELPGTGPVRRVEVRGMGPGSDGVGTVLAGNGPEPWRLPILSNHHRGPGPVLVAAGEPVRLAGGASAVGTAGLPPGSLERLAPVGSGRPGRPGTWFRYRAPRLWEYPRAALALPGVRWAAALLALVLGGGVALRARRSAARRTADQSWTDLLTRVGLSSHARWRSAVFAAMRILRELRMEVGSDGDSGALRTEAVARLERAVPAEVLENLRRGIEIAELLGLEGAKTARAALRSLDAARRGDLRNLDRLLSEGRALENSMGLVQRALAERYSADAAAVFDRVLEYGGLAGDGSARVVFANGGGASGEEFPMRPEDLFACLEELISNALKKVPAPREVRVEVRDQEGKSVVLEVWDDGAPVPAERSREGRPGSRRGLGLLERILEPYGGSLELHDEAGGGVRAAIRVPRYDLY